MNEYIEREPLFNAIYDMACKTVLIPGCEDYAAGLREAANYVEQAPAADVVVRDVKHEWISVKDKLPERGEQVLLIAYGWSGTTVYVGRLEHMAAETSWLTGITSKESEWLIQGWSYLREPIVTHWMPLPKVPKEAITDDA